MVDKMKIDIGKFKEKKVFSDFDVKDSDNDGVYDVFDCDPHNPRRHGIQPSQTMKKRLSELPIFFVSTKRQEGTVGGRPITLYTLEKERVTMKREGSQVEVVKRVPKKVYEAQRRFLSAVKKRPEIVGEIEKTRPSKVVVTTFRTEEEAGYAVPEEERTGRIIGRKGEQHGIVVHAGGSPGSRYDYFEREELAGTVIHEAEHVKQFQRWKSKPKLQSRMAKGRYEKRPQEIQARRAEARAERKRYSGVTEKKAKEFWQGYRRMTK